MVAVSLKNSTNLPTEATIGYRYTPNSDFNGADRFTVGALDEFGGITFKDIDLTVNAVDDTATGWTITELTPAYEDTTITGIVYANDVDGGIQTYSIDVPAENGTVKMLDQNTGIWQYAPNTDYHGDDKFTITATDATNKTSMCSFSDFVYARSPTVASIEASPLGVRVAIPF
ncbi:hypothetical protein IMSAGC009_04033 [Lachnospiraceae bacterium]|nr:hypothetical protein IMSAGC009_04033 [Lachnospiraceae bacterium]